MGFFTCEICHRPYRSTMPYISGPYCECKPVTTTTDNVTVPYTTITGRIHGARDYTRNPR